MHISRRSLLKGLAAGGAAAAVGTGAEAREPSKLAPDAVGMLYDSTLCVGCRACERACKDANGMPPETARIDGVPYEAPRDLSGDNRTVIKRYEDGETQAWMKANCMHCVDPACVSACMLGALHKEAGGVVAYDPETCVGCRYCQIACPFNVPKFQWADQTPEIVKCELCRHRWPEGKGAACAEVCPRGAIRFGNVQELTAEAHRRMDASPDRYRPKVYGEHDAGGTQVLVLSAREIPFEALGLPDLGDAPVPQLSETVQHGIYKGFIAPAALYAIFGVAAWRNHRAQKKAEGGKESGQ